MIPPGNSQNIGSKPKGARRPQGVASAAAPACNAPWTTTPGSAKFKSDFTPGPGLFAFADLFDVVLLLTG